MTAGYCTLGCRVNQYETEAIAQELSKLGIENADFGSKCDFYIINTCAVTEESVRKSRQMVRRAITSNRDAFVGVVGCASQLEGELFASIEGVSAVFGTRNKHDIRNVVKEYLKSGKKPEKRLNIEPPDGELARTRIDTFGRTRAYVKIQDGCGGKCTYCVIPRVRGGIVSRDRADILCEIKGLVRNGCHEVVLTGIETAAYGQGLAELISEIDKIDGIERIRLGSLEPSFMKPAFADKIANVPSLCRHFHLSMQNGSDRVLNRMKRKYSVKMLEENAAYIRSVMPEVNFSADVIVGFPGETEEDFLQTCEVCKRIGFLHLHIFTYSKRPETEAAEMPDQIPEKIKSERLQRLSEIANQTKTDILNKVIEKGTELSVLVETVHGGFAFGHTDNFIECKADVSSTNITYLKGSIISVIPISVSDGKLFCKPAEMP